MIGLKGFAPVFRVTFVTFFAKKTQSSLFFLFLFKAVVKRVAIRRGCPYLVYQLATCVKIWFIN